MEFVELVYLFTGPGLGQGVIIHTIRLGYFVSKLTWVKDDPGGL